MVSQEPEEFEAYKPHKAVEFEEKLLKHRGEKMLMVIKGYPDPDSIACSMAHKLMGEAFGVVVDILHFDDISHPENLALIKKLDVEMTRYSPEASYDDYPTYALSDTQSPELPVKLHDGIKLFSFVDHHKRIGQIDAEHVDIRETTGSASSIYCEYLSEGSFTLESGNQDHVRVATALMHGIKSDTDNFVNAQALDYWAAGFLAQYVDKDLLKVISRQQVSAKTMDIMEIALERKQIHGTFLVSGVGAVREADRDGIGQAADFLLNREGIETVIVYGVVGGHTIDGSLRTSSHTLEPDAWIKEIFGQSMDGKAYGGGRRDKGGFQIPLGIFGRCKDKDLVWQIVQKTIEGIIDEGIGVEGKT